MSHERYRVEIVNCDKKNEAELRKVIGSIGLNETLKTIVPISGGTIGVFSFVVVIERAS